MASGWKFCASTVALAATMLAGCKTAEPRRPAPEVGSPGSQLPVAVDAAARSPSQPHVDPAVRPASAQQLVVQFDSQPADSPALTPTPPELVPAAGQLSLFDAIELGLTQNPDLTAQRYAEGPGQGALGVAETYPFNPWVQVQVTPSQQSSVSNTGPVNHYVLLMQQLQLGHQRVHRTNAAAATLNSIRWNIVQAELTNMAQTQRLYFTVLYQRDVAQLIGANAELNNQLLAISQKQLEAGTAAGADVAILRLDYTAARRQARLAEANYQSALLDLKRHLGLPPMAPLELPGRLANWRFQVLSHQSELWSHHLCVAIPATDDRNLVARSLAAGRPDVWAAHADVDTARANLELARANRIPDLQIGPYYQRNNDPTTYIGLRAQMDLPVLNTGNPLVRQRLAELGQRQAIWQQTLERASLEALAALDRYDRALLIATDVEAASNEELPSELQKLETQFRAGEVDLVRVVTARTSFFQARRATLDTLNELAQASAGLVSAAGVPPAALVQPDYGL